MIKDNKPNSQIKNAKYMKILAHVFAIIGVVFVLFVSFLVGLLIILAAAYIYFQASKFQKLDKKKIKLSSKRK